MIKNIKIGGLEMKRYLIFILSGIFLTGCATYKTASIKEEIIDMKLKQAISIAETSLEISKNAEKLAIEAVNTSNEAKANSEEAIKKVDEAIEAVNETRKFTEREVQRAIDAANKASQEAIKASNEARDKAIEAANKAIEEANKASERAIAVANQTIAEINRVRATILTKPEEPIVEEEPKTGKYYVIQKGDTLKKISYKFYGTVDKWELIYSINKHIIKNPNVLKPGTKIYIP